ncbi:sarcosine oxidase subunit gamma [Seohaeicola saemankumensis]|nr:sarcosine oxidase subunit gamma family protein [Seohaeicola saemankumensis]MCA0869817.1 sarcosine oxidase subunit gamma [Seohaeicola saemankumensis]
MSEPISALKMAGFDGLARVEDCGLQGMITLRGDLSARAVKSAVTAATGLTGPKQPGPLQIVSGKSGSAAWMSPDEMLLLCPYGETGSVLAAMQEKLAKVHALAVDVSDARVQLQVAGPSAREVMAKLCPLDLSPENFQPGTIRRTRMAQIPAALWMVDEATFRVICFRSVADYAFNLLKTAAHPESGVGYF